MNIFLLTTTSGNLWQQSYDNVWFTISVPMLDSIQWFGLLELPLLLTTLFATVLLSFHFKHAKFSDHLLLLFWGIIIVALGQFRMETSHLFHSTLLHHIFGYTIREYLWYITLSITWGLPLLGFYNLYIQHRQ